MLTRIIGLLILLPGVAVAQGFDTIDFWVGQGSQQAAVVIDWDGPGGQAGLSWGVRWDGEATAAALVTAITQADPRLYALFTQDMVTLIGFGYDSGDLVFSTTPEATFSFGLSNNAIPDSGRVADGDGDRYTESSTTTGWVYWRSVTGMVDSWALADSGTQETIVSDDEWIGISFTSLTGSLPPGEYAPASLPVYSGPVDTEHLIDPAIVWDDPRILGWASSVVQYHRADSDFAFGNPALALGVPGTEFQVVSLGDLYPEDIEAGNPPGSITVSFDIPLGNGPGFDLAVFENGFLAPDEPGLIFAELAYVEVSTDGEHYIRFPGHYIAGDSPIGGYSFLEADHIYNLAGKHGAHSYDSPILSGTPFDLDQLRFDPDVLSGAVNLDEIRYVRVVDIPGSGDWKDAHANPIYDSWPTWGSGGFDLNAVAAMNSVQVTLTVDEIRTDQTSPALTGTVGRDDVSITLLVNGSTYTAVNNENGTWTLASGMLPPLPYGSYEVEAGAEHPEWGQMAEATGLLTIFDSEFRAWIQGPERVYRPSGMGWTFIAGVNGAVEPVSYQWYQVVDGVETALPGGQSLEWSIDSAGPDAEGSYFIEITDGDGNTVRSGVVTLQVMDTQQVPLSWMTLALLVVLLALVACRQTRRSGYGM